MSVDVLCVHTSDLSNAKPQSSPLLQSMNLLTQESETTHQQTDIMKQLLRNSQHLNIFTQSY